MKKVKKIQVFSLLNFREDFIGEIIEEGDCYYFRYVDSYLNFGHNISPFKLKFDNSIQKVDTDIFEGLFGVFYDSIPDGWGRLLVDRFLMNKGLSLTEINPLVRLSVIGMNCIGSLGYKPVLANDEQEIEIIDLDQIYKKSLDIYDDKLKDLDLIYKLGGSSGGARPKIWVNFAPESKKLSYLKSKKSEAWIIKFPSSFDIKDMAKVEYVYYKMALACSIEMNESILFKGASGSKYFGTKRFDITKNNKRLHMISAAGLLHDNYRMTSLDYGHVMHAAFTLTNSVKSYEDVLRLAVFNVLSGNKDDHSKNFSFLMDEKGHWRIAPAYDLTYSTSSHGYQSTSVDGVSKDIKYYNFNNLALLFGVKHLETITDEVIRSLDKFKILAQEVKLSKLTTKMIETDISNNIKYFFG